MAVYTIEFRKVPELYKATYGEDFWETLDWPLPNFVKNGDNPDEWLKNLQNKVFMHYKYNEICCGSFERFHDFMQDVINTDMPYFNKLYDANALEWNFDTITKLKEVTEDSSGTTRNTTDSGTKSNTGTVTNNANGTRANTGTVTNNANGTKANTGTVGNVEGKTRNNTGTVTDKFDGSVDNTGTVTNTGSGGDTVTNNNLAVASDTPHNLLNVANDIQSNLYANAATKTENTETTIRGSIDTRKDNTNQKTDNKNVRTDATIEKTDTESTRTDNTLETTEDKNTRTDDTLETTEDNNTRTDNTLETNKNTQDETISNTYKHIRTVDGSTARPYVELYEKYTEVKLNIDKMVVKAFSSCFMSVY